MSRLQRLRLVRQEDPKGCSYACIAMLCEKSYAEVRNELGDPGGGTTPFLWHEVLARAGYAYQFFYPYNPVRKAQREQWPLPLWAEAHLCSVDAGGGNGSHVVIVMRDGTVFDPLQQVPGFWEEYRGIGYMTGLFDVGTRPTA